MRSLGARHEAALPPFFAVGGAGVLAQAAALRGLDVPIEPIADPAEAAAIFGRALPVLGAMTTRNTVPARRIGRGPPCARLADRRPPALAVEGAAAASSPGRSPRSLLAEVGFRLSRPDRIPRRRLRRGRARRGDDAGRAAVAHCAAHRPLRWPRFRACISVDLIVSRCRIVAAGLRHDFGIEHPRARDRRAQSACRRRRQVRQ